MKLSKSLFLFLVAVVATPALRAVVPADLATWRASGDLQRQRAHVWEVFASITASGPDGAPRFETWYGEDQVFGSTADSQGLPGIRGFSRSSARNNPSSSAGAPVLTYTLYNAPAYQHIRRHRLHERSTLGQLRRAGSVSVPDFPAEAMLLKTAWWPVAHGAPTALPVWDPQHNPARAGGNPYSTWPRVVVIAAAEHASAPQVQDTEFAGRRFAAPRGVAIESFHHVTVTPDMAARLARDSDAAKVALIALGRPIEAGDRLVLVGANLATREISDWVWAALWWHDRPQLGEYANGRPAYLAGPWRNFLMQTAFDAVLPLSADGSPHVCFNPWLEARFADGGSGGGVVSNCMACHGRASYPASDFLPVTRGAASADDPAHAADRLRTSLLWSLALHASGSPPASSGR